MKAIVPALLFFSTMVAANPSESREVSWVFVLTAHNANGAIEAVDTEGPFLKESECKAIGEAVTRRVYEVIGSMQPDNHSALEWDKLTTSCEKITSAGDQK